MMSSPPRDHRSDLERVARQAMLARGLLPDFDAAALKQLAEIRVAQIETGTDVRDLRSLLWCSIDNDESRDLDQLSVAQPGTGAAVTILVAVADVDALVALDSAIDQHARTNSTSVYTAAGVFPMLPERLSTDLSSLGEHDDRLALVTELVIGPD